MPTHTPVTTFRQCDALSWEATQSPSVEALASPELEQHAAGNHAEGNALLRYADGLMMPALLELDPLCTYATEEETRCMRCC